MSEQLLFNPTNYWSSEPFPWKENILPSQQQMSWLCCIIKTTSPPHSKWLDSIKITKNAVVQCISRPCLQQWTKIHWHHSNTLKYTVHTVQNRLRLPWVCFTNLCVSWLGRPLSLHTWFVFLVLMNFSTVACQLQSLHLSPLLQLSVPSRFTFKVDKKIPQHPWYFISLVKCTVLDASHLSDANQLFWRVFSLIRQLKCVLVLKYECMGCNSW